MIDSTVEAGLPDLPTQFRGFANDLVRWSQLKVVRGFTTSKAADPLERDLGEIARQWRTRKRDFADRATSKLQTVGAKYKANPLFASFKNVNLASPGGIDAVAIQPRNLNMGEIGAVIGGLGARGIVGPGVILVPEATNKVLRLHTKTIHCDDETDEWSASDEIVWSYEYVTPTGGTGYRWWRRVDFDKGETKPIELVKSFSVPQRFPNKFGFVFSMLEEDNSDAADVVEATWEKLKAKVKEKIDAFADWLAAEIGVPELGELIGSILNWVANSVIGWLVKMFGPDPMGTLPYTVTLNGGMKWKSTGNSILPVTLSHRGSGGSYKVSLQFELA